MAPLSRPLVRLLTLLSIASLVLVGLILYASPSASSIASRYRGQLGAQFQGLKDPTQWGINPWRRPGTGTGTGTGTGEGAIPSFKGEEAAVVADSATATSGHPFLNGQPVIWVNGKGWVQADSDPPGDVTAPVRPTAPIPSTPAQAQQRPTESVKMIIPDWLLPPEDRPPVPPPRFEPDPPGLPIPSPPQTTSSPLLNVRLAQLLAAPAPGRLEAFLANLEKCSHTIFQTDITQLVQHRKFWVEDVQSGREVLHKWRGELVRALERLESKGVPIVAKGEKGTGSKG